MLGNANSNNPYSTQKPTITYTLNRKKTGKTIYNAILKAPDDIRIVLLSGTPMFDKPSEIGLTLNLLKLKNEFPVGTKFNDKFLKIYKKNNEIIYEMKNEK